MRCFACEEYVRCGKKQEPPVQVSSRNPTEIARLQDLLKRLQDRHVECAQVVAKKAAADDQAAAVVASPDTPNVLQTMIQVEQTKNHAKTSNKSDLEVEKEKDAAEKLLSEVEELKRQLQPKRVRAHDDGDAHEMFAGVDNWDLSVHHREATLVQNRRNVALGSLQDQPKSRTGKDGFFP